LPYPAFQQHVAVVLAIPLRIFYVSQFKKPGVDSHNPFDEVSLLEAAGSIVCFMRTIGYWLHHLNRVISMHLFGFQLLVVRPNGN